jgi:hypothetical protein
MSYAASDNVVRGHVLTPGDAVHEALLRPNAWHQASSAEQLVGCLQSRKPLHALRRSKHDVVVHVGDDVKGQSFFQKTCA